MKKIKIKQAWRSAISLFALGIFILIAYATIPGTSQQKHQLPDGRWEISKHYSDGNTETTTGNVDGYGRWNGPVKVEYENDNYMLTHTEEVNMKEGKRHGISKVTYPGGYVATDCYEHGERVDNKNCEKSARIVAEDFSAYGILSYDIPWFAFKLDALGYDSVYVKAYMDTIETQLYATEFNEEEFDDYYDDVINELEDTSYDSIIVLNAELSIYNGWDLILNNEFRLATLYSYRESEGNTYNVVKTIYPNYLLKLNEREVNDADFEAFCSEYDMILSGFDQISPDDPFWLDSMDARMFIAIDSIYSSDEGSAMVAKSIKSAFVLKEVKTADNLLQELFMQTKKSRMDKTPKEVSEVVLVSILEGFIKGDLIKNAVRKAYAINKGIVRLPTLTTNFLSILSSSSVSLNGNIIDNGGGGISSRGMVWGISFNPTIDNQMLSAGTGTGIFSATLTELEEGVTYYARAFAVNSAGIAYGNCIEFTTSDVVSARLTALEYMELAVFPNPASGLTTFNFNAEKPDKMMLSIISVNGQVVLQIELNEVTQGDNRVEINLSHLENGVYTGRIVIDDYKQINRKFLIAH